MGTMHALEARRRGHEVVQLERDVAPRGASRRNFGHLLVSGRAPGEELEAAVRARQRWEEIAAEVPGVGFRRVGTLNVALDDATGAVHEEVAARDDAELRGFRHLTAAEVRELEPSIHGDVRSGLWSDRDARVEPRLAVLALQQHLAAASDGSGGGTYELFTGRAVESIEGTAVVDRTGARHEGDVVVVCTGADHRLHDADGLQRCQLQMFETRPLPTELRVSITDVGSLRYYPAFAGDAVAALDPVDGPAERWRLQLLMVQRLDGSVTVGDTHVYDEPFGFDYDTQPEELLLGRARAVLGRGLPPVVRRWLGVYSKCLDERLVEHRTSTGDGVWSVTGLGGRGMTLSPAVAERTFEEIDR